MGIITPTSDEKSSSNIKNLISASLKSLLKESITIVDDSLGVTVSASKAQALSKRLLDIALYCDSPKTSVTAAKVILEYTEGKPAVRDDKEKKSLPVVEFVLHSDEEVEDLKAKAKLIEAPKEEEFSLDEVINE